jgi:hypothetical protein
LASATAIALLLAASLGMVFHFHRSPHHALLWWHDRKYVYFFLTYKCAMQKLTLSIDDDLYAMLHTQAGRGSIWGCCV